MSPTTYTTCSNPKCLTKFSISSLQNSPTPSLILCLHCQGRVCACGGPKQPEVDRCIRCRNRSEVTKPPTTKAVKAKTKTGTKPSKTPKTAKPKLRERKRTLPNLPEAVNSSPNDLSRLGHLTLVHSTPKAKAKTPK